MLKLERPAFDSGILEHFSVSVTPVNVTHDARATDTCHGAVGLHLVAVLATTGHIDTRLRDRLNHFHTGRIQNILTKTVQINKLRRFRKKFDTNKSAVSFSSHNIGSGGSVNECQVVSVVWKCESSAVSDVELVVHLQRN